MWELRFDVITTFWYFAGCFEVSVTLHWRRWWCAGRFLAGRWKVGHLCIKFFFIISCYLTVLLISITSGTINDAVVATVMMIYHVTTCAVVLCVRCWCSLCDSMQWMLASSVHAVRTLQTQNVILQHKVVKQYNNNQINQSLFFPLSFYCALQWKAFFPHQMVCC